MIKHIFRYVCLIAAYVVAVFFLIRFDDYHSKFPVMIGGVMGITVAYILVMIIIRYRRKKTNEK
jgi:uncharacterized membrane protein YjjB (DUF3815 family)